MKIGVHVVSKRLATGQLRWYVYAWRGGPLVKAVDGPRPVKLTNADHAMIVEAKKGISAPDPTTLLALCRAWRPDSPEWAALADTTKQTWGAALNAIENKWGKVPLEIFNDPRMVAKVVKWRDSRAATPRAADMGVTVLKALLTFGRLRAAVSINVAAGIPKLYRGGDRAEIIWTDADLARFRITAIAMGLEHVADAADLAARTGLRRHDLVTLTDRHVERFVILKKALKTSRGRRRFATIPRIPSLDEILVRVSVRFRQAGVQTVLVNSRGKPWTPGGLTGQFNRVRDAAGIVHTDEETDEVRSKHLHDLRGTFATRLMIETDLTDEEIADVMAWEPARVVRIRKVYVDQRHVVMALGTRSVLAGIAQW